MKKSLFIITLLFYTSSLFCSDDVKKEQKIANNLARFNEDFKPRYIVTATKKSCKSGLLTFAKLCTLRQKHSITSTEAEIIHTTNSSVVALVHPKSTMEFRSSLLIALEANYKNPQIEVMEQNNE